MQMQCIINIVYMCNSHAAVDLILMAVDQKDRALERGNTYIYCTISYLLTKPHLSTYHAEVAVIY